MPPFKAAALLKCCTPPIISKNVINVKGFVVLIAFAIGYTYDTGFKITKVPSILPPVVPTDIVCVTSVHNKALSLGNNLNHTYQ